MNCAGPQGRRAAYGCISGVIAAVNIEQSSSDGNFERKCHTGRVTCISFCRDSSRIMSAGIDTFIQIWNIADARLVGSIENVYEAINIAFSGDGQFIIHTDYDGVSKIGKQLRKS